MSDRTDGACFTLYVDRAGPARWRYAVYRIDTKGEEQFVAFDFVHALRRRAAVAAAEKVAEDYALGQVRRTRSLAVIHLKQPTAVVRIVADDSVEAKAS